MKRGVCVVVMMLSSALVLAQTPRFKSQVAAVRVDVLVTDGRRPVQGLTVADFELRDNGVVQTITDVHHETLPLNLICALDLSGSVQGRPLENLKRAYLSLIEALGDADRAALLTFAHRIELHSTLTGDRKRLASLIGPVEAGGSTSLFDAVFSAMALREADDGRTLLLFFSDARDTSSWLTARKLVEAARRSDVVIYPVTIRTPLPTVLSQGHNIYAQQHRREPAEQLLETLTDLTGGRAVYASDDSELESTFLAVLQEFRQRYVLTFIPSRVADDGWHTLDVKLKGRAGSVRGRRGYFAR